MININGKKYVMRGSSEDNGTYSYYYTDTITNTYNIIYEGQRGTVTLSTVVYKDESTNEIISKDYFSWTLRYGNVYRSGTCLTQADEQEIYDFIDNNKTDNDGNTSNNNDGLNSSTGNNTYDNAFTDEFDEYGNRILNSDDPNNLQNKGQDNSGDSSTGLFDDSMGSGGFNFNRNSLPRGADIKNPEIFANEDFEQQSGKWDNAAGNNIMNKGTLYPIIRINDHYFQQNEIEFFSMETGYYKNFYDYATFKMPITGFIPTMKLIAYTSNPNLLKRNFVKQGDRCSVFFTSNHIMVKSMRCDFRITNVVTNNMDQNRTMRYNRFIIQGELYIPDLRNEEIRYNFNGSSRDAMMDLAKRLRLSFFFCDPEDTDDVMVWCNCKNLEMFAKDLTTHAWKNPSAFFESWIDPRYGLSFQNINKLLIEDGLDEPIDITFWINTFVNNRGVDGKKTEKTPDEKIKDSPQAKIFTNIPTDDESMTVYHVNKWRMVNNAQEIQDFIGLNCKQQFESVNPGLYKNSNYVVEQSLCINKTKADPSTGDKNDFYVLLGPARNMTYANADDEMKTSETESSNTKDPEKIANTQSDGDAEDILASDGNMNSSGNTHKFYDVAYEHNMRNLLQLQKQYLLVELNGANLTILRGEKIPIILIDINKADAAIRTEGENYVLTEFLYEAESGWYIIDGIEWVYDPMYSDEGTGTCWRTNVKITRREWPIPGRALLNQPPKNQNIEVTINVGNGETRVLAYKDAIQQGYKPEDMIFSGGELDNVDVIYKKDTTVVTDQDESGVIYSGVDKSETVKVEDFDIDLLDQYIIKADVVPGTEIPLTGLKDYMKELYKLINEASDKKIKLVSARRWAVDEQGKKVDGNAFIKKGGYYKCMNAIGQTLYFKSNNSRHLYGEAFDIINVDIDFTELMTNVIMRNKDILSLMLENGISAYIEQAKDDTGTTTKHYHFGTDTIKQKEFWASVKAILGSDKIPGTLVSFSNYMKYNRQQAEFTRYDLDESLINSTLTQNLTGTNNNNNLNDTNNSLA